jgi:hypothetical protein
MRKDGDGTSINFSIQNLRISTPATCGTTEIATCGYTIIFNFLFKKNFKPFFLKKKKKNKNLGVVQPPQRSKMGVDLWGSRNYPHLAWGWLGHPHFGLGVVRPPHEPKPSSSFFFFFFFFFTLALGGITPIGHEGGSATPECQTDFFFLIFSFSLAFGGSRTIPMPNGGGQPPSCGPKATSNFIYLFLFFKKNA